MTVGPNKVLTFAGGPALCEHEWNQIARARREQAYVYAIAGIIHCSSHLAMLFLVESIVQAETRWRHSKHPRVSVALDCHPYVIKDGAAAAAGDYFWNFIFIFLECKQPAPGTHPSAVGTRITRRVSVMTYVTVNLTLVHFDHALDVCTTLWRQ